MIAIDTNVIVRLLTKDDPVQYAQSLSLFQENDIFISDTVLLETEWVLRFSYAFQPSDVYQALNQLLGLPNVQVMEGNRVAQALQWHNSSGLGFADAFHLACCQHCSVLYTFDKQFVRHSQGLTDVQVIDPSQP
jgi:predicted nucleic-acid-binding protein